MISVGKRCFSSRFLALTAELRISISQWTRSLVYSSLEGEMSRERMSRETKSPLFLSRRGDALRLLLMYGQLCETPGSVCFPISDRGLAAKTTNLLTGYSLGKKYKRRDQ